MTPEQLIGIVDKLITAGIIGWVAVVTQHVFMHPRKDKKQKDILFDRLRRVENGGTNHQARMGVKDDVGSTRHCCCPACPSVPGVDKREQ